MWVLEGDLGFSGLHNEGYNSSKLPHQAPGLSLSVPQSVKSITLIHSSIHLTDPPLKGTYSGLPVCTHQGHEWFESDVDGVWHAEDAQCVVFGVCFIKAHCEIEEESNI